MTSLTVDAVQHIEEVEYIKQQLGIEHNYLDNWIYSFLQNKNYDIEETLKKLQRRADVEKNELSTHVITDYMRENLRSGIIQLIGEDRDGRPTFYVVSARDFPKSSQREERKKIFDMWLSYGIRLRPNDLRGKITLLVNQKNSGVWANTDMTFQTNVAIRIAKYYPGSFEKIYLCCMSSALSTFARPIIGAMPKAISEKVTVITEKEINAGKLRQYFDDDTIPVVLGGNNDCDTEENYQSFADKVEEYFVELQDAYHDGQSFKDYEVSQLIKHEQEQHQQQQQEQQQLLASTRSRIMPSDLDLDAISVGLRTCDSLDGSLHGGDEQMQVYSPQHRHPSGGFFPGDTLDFCALLESQEFFFRENLEELELSNRLDMMHQFGTWRREVSSGLEAERAAMVLTARCPRSLRSLLIGILWFLNVIVAAFFLVATVFVQMAMCSMVVLIFFSMFLEDYFVFPLGLTLVLVGYHGAQLSTRGFELVMATFRGQVFKPLKPLGRRGILLQTVVYLVLLLLQFSLFVYYASDVHPGHGLSVSFAWGCVVCACIVLLMHVIYPTKLVHADSTESRIGGLTLYLFFNLDEKPTQQEMPKSLVLMLVVPTLFAVTSGLCFIASKILFFAVATLITTSIATFIVNQVVGRGDGDYTRYLARSATWLAAMIWIFTVFVAGFIGLNESWSRVIGVSLGVVSLFVAISCAGYVSTDIRIQRYILRTGYALFAGLLICGIVITFSVHVLFGVFALGLFIHSAATFMRTYSTEIWGLGVTALGSLLVCMSVLLIAWSAVEPDYTDRHAVRVQPIPQPEDSYPLCLRSWGGSTTPEADRLHALDFAFLTQVAYASPVVANADLAVLMPGYVLEEEHALELVKVKIYSQVHGNLSVAVFRATTDPMDMFHAMSMWVESLAFAPLAAIFPANYTSNLIYATSFLHDLLPMKWSRTVDVAQSTLGTYMAVPSGQNRTLFVTGHSIGGGVAQVVAARLGVKALSFGSPGTLHTMRKFSLRWWDMEKLLTAVVPISGTVATLDQHAGIVQQTICNGKGAVDCNRHLSLLCDLLRSCGSPDGRAVVACGRVEPG